jgi:uncharacterized protein (TIGR02246 family)
MKITITLVGLLAVAGAGLVMAAGNREPGQEAAGAATAAQGQPAPAPQPKAASPDEHAIRGGVEAFAKLYSGADAQGLAELFVDDAELIDPEGNATRGKAALSQMYAAAFQESPGLKLEAKVEEVRFLTPDVARVEGRSQVFSAAGDASEFNRFSVLLVKHDGKWRIAEVHERAAPAADVSPYDRLKDLEWMIGDWVDESDNNRVQSSVRWADNNSFLVRTYSSEVQGEKRASGTMFIGWDPQSGQIKSWLFDSNGGHGEGLWTRTGANEWVIKAQGVLSDGRPTSATQIHTIINKDSVKTSSIDRIIGGQVAPDIVDIIMVRKAPAPGAPSPKPAATAIPQS